ncbi:hypothetical protein BY458DRAFT_431487 [Sporodiniella umbellata]|nr:hypothetical protein BY458DRAFT_431487 [Sporodiniella umbellata]
MASLLSTLAYLYTLLLIPLIKTSSILPVANISVPLDIGCSQLPPRISPAATVHDLRPDDIKVVIGLGDSVMAGFAAKGIQTRFVNTKNLYENRGISFALGGDQGAVTMPNILNYYSHNLYGPSVGNHIISICFGNQFCPNGQYRDDIDMLNAAQSGARSLNLDHQLSYIFDRLDTEYEAGRIHPNDWKLVTLFIGSNDICHSCTEPTSLPYPFGTNIWSTVETLKAKTTNTLVQIIGLMRVQDIVVSTSKYPEYCQPIKFSNFVGHDHECECSHTETNLTIMNDNFAGYNKAIQQVVSKYNEPNDTFAVIYQPLLVDIMSFPIQAIR